MTLPVNLILPKLIVDLTARRCAVLQAPPGAGKTTVVPLALDSAGCVRGKIIMSEPRRIAARAAAERLAQHYNEPVGRSVGYRMRGDSKPGRKIEVVTEGILTRMIQSDPELTGIGAIIFDEFHERNLHSDVGLALTREVTQALRDDLMVLVMSATLDAAPVAAYLDDAPVITSSGRSFPVNLCYLDKPLPASMRIEQAMADRICHAAIHTSGGILAFLPGEGEIRRVAELLQGRLPQDCRVFPLYGALPFSKQQVAIAPQDQGRKIVLATSIAETSLTIQDISVVVDSGLARRARFDPSSGMSRLVTEKVTQAEATQRAGRAGRVAEGTAFRLWTAGQNGALARFAQPEIETADLCGLALELALWGAADLPFLTAPPAEAMREARELLMMIGALDQNERITAHGKALAKIPLHPRLAHMVVVAGRQAAPLAALLDKGRVPGGVGDIENQLKGIENKHHIPGDPLAPVRVEAQRLARGLPEKPALSYAEMAALAYPDRVGLRRKGSAPRYLLSGGKGAVLPPDSLLAEQRMIVALTLDGHPTEAKIKQALPFSESLLKGLFHADITEANLCEWSPRERRVLTRQHRKFRALVLEDRPLPDPDPGAVARAMIDGVRDLGLTLKGSAARFRARVEMVRQAGADLPAMDDDSLMASLETWLMPYIIGLKNAESWKAFDPTNALRAMLDWSQMQMLDQRAPSHFVTPLSRKISIDYDAQPPEISLRLQEMFGVTQHPQVAGMPLRVVLLSPGGKPVQVTTDIPGFWANSYADVRRDMRGQYPKHPWPEDPTKADPTLYTKRRQAQQ